MEYHPEVDISESMQANPFDIMNSTTMIIPTPSKVEITDMRSFSQENEIKDEDSKVGKRLKVDSDREMIEFEGKKIKKKVQSLDFQIHEYSFA